MGTIEHAIALAARAHAGQTDKSDEPYILHPLRVMLNVKLAGGTTEQQIAAVLHDVVEDTPVSLREISESFGEAVSMMVDALTRRPDESYTVFQERVLSVPGARQIKLSDIHDNFDRLHVLSNETERERLASKYSSALEFIDSKAESAQDRMKTR